MSVSNTAFVECATVKPLCQLIAQLLEGATLAYQNVRIVAGIGGLVATGATQCRAAVMKILPLRFRTAPVPT